MAKKKLTPKDYADRAQAERNLARLLELAQRAQAELDAKKQAS